MIGAPQDATLRQAAFDHVNRLAALNGGVLDSNDLAAGLQFQGERIPLINPQRGIFKPRQMLGLLSIRTVRDLGTDSHFAGPAANGPLVQIPGTGVIWKICPSQ